VKCVWVCVWEWLQDIYIVIDIAVIINIITSSSSSLSSTSHLRTVAPIGITEQCYRTLWISGLVLRAAAWVWKESTQKHFFEHFAPSTVVPTVTVFAPSLLPQHSIWYAQKTFLVLDMIWNQKNPTFAFEFSEKQLAYTIDRNLRSENGSVSLELDLWILWAVCSLFSSSSSIAVTENEYPPSSWWSLKKTEILRYWSYCNQKRDRCPQGLRARQHRQSVACVVVKITQKGPSGRLGPPLLAWRHETCPTPWLSKFSHFKLSEIGNFDGSIIERIP